MGERRIRKMLRQMESGEPVRVTSAVATTTKLARCAAMAQKFGYEYADVRQGGGPQGNQYVVLIVPDPAPEARARAARNRARYPRAADGGELPRLAPDAVELLKARITFDITTMYTDRQLILLTGFCAVPLALTIGFAFGTGAVAVVLAGVVWAAVMALLPVGFAANRRFRARCAALLRAAGFTPVTDPNGRLRYLPPGGRIPGHGNPFAG
ncbi:hypothetical protein AB0A94_18265 [Streptomyces sp. NPDC044984]|uniref:hypothetical protein n=1 Tax=Streptomyces sp. NPDC044984 TaxID=3154335 RepID=UPI0033FE36DF